MKYKNYILILFLSVLGIACNSLDESIPTDLIPSNKMARILVDIHEVEMQVSRMGLNTYDSSQVAYNYLEQKIFESFEVDSSQYRKSYEYYAAHPSKFLRIYDDVERMTKEKQE